ncbi:MAG: glycosyltransferase [Planctomycetota bacterium]
MPDQPGPTPPQGFLFDQWSRYAAAAEGVRALAPAGGTVLDVGCGESMLLGSFLPEHELSYLDPLLQARDGEHTGNGTIVGKPLDAASVPDDSYDVVVCVDVLEHVPAEARQRFVAQMVRASRLGVVIAAPFADVGEARRTDDIVHLAYHAKHGRDYDWLHEHELYGLPRLGDVEQQLRGDGLQVARFGNGHTPWLQDLLSLHVVLLDRAEHTPLLREMGDRFAEQLLRFDHLEPTYRQVVIAGRDAPTAPPHAPDDRATREAAREAWHRFRTWADARLSSYADQLVAQRDGTLEQLTLLRRRLDQANEQVACWREEIDEARTALDEANAELAQLRAAPSQAVDDLEAMQNSLSWRVTGPLRLALRLPGASARVVRKGLIALANRGARSKLADRWRWPLKVAFFAVFRPLLKDSREYADFLAAKRWRNRPAPPHVADVEPPHATLPDVIVFGVIDWHLRTQRPQHLAVELARRGHRVLYLSPAFQSSTQPGYQLDVVHERPRIHQVRLHTNRPTSIYEDVPPPVVSAFLIGGLRKLLGDVSLSTCIALVDHPCWIDLVEQVPRCLRIYDCMDNHHGFEDSGAGLPRAEQRLLHKSDAVIVTSNHIERDIAPQHDSVHMVRNACAPDDFAAATAAPPDGRRPVVGYFGAIAAWFDVDLVEAVARALPEVDFLLVGDDTAGVQKRLQHVRNVRFTGEVAYALLPEHLRLMDVLLIPFVINQLTLATNPVKAYEALAAGKPVVATPMPELIETDVRPFVRIGEDAEGIATALRAALADAHDPDAMAQRVAFARRQTWAHRAEALLEAVAAAPRPKVCVVVVSWNGLELTRRCVHSVLDDPMACELDVVVVDNDSQDDTPAWLDEIEQHPRVRVIRNDDNLGFAAACNQGLEAGATHDPDLLVILNNDLVVTPGWAWTLHHHLQDHPDVGLIGPVTNNIGNEAKIATSYTSVDEMLGEQRALTGRVAGQTFDIPVLAFFCVAMPFDVYRQVGGLDENFGQGFFEDDDYCQRVRGIGRRIVCAEDVFIHHELSASFDKIDQEARRRLFERNKAYYESKWGPWQRHEYRSRNSG